jgi:hypothetical protein
MPITVTACTSRPHNVEILALNGDEPQAGALVISHRASGELIESVHVDASAHASVQVEDDSFVTVVFPPDDVATRLFTVAVVGMTETLRIHGPPPAPTFQTIGHVDVAPAVAQPADDYEVRLACRNAQTTTWPMSVEIDATCVGVDSRIPVIAIARAGGQPLAYASGMVTLENGVATFAPSAWLPATPNVPVDSSDLTAQFDWTLWIDGLPFQDSLVGGGLLWDGLLVERTTIHGWRGDFVAAQHTTRQLVGPPSSVLFGAEDFLPALPRTLTATGLPTKAGVGQPLHFSWSEARVDADILHLALGWLSLVDPSDVLWTIVLPPDATEFTTPKFEGEFQPFTPGSDPDLALRWIDSPDLVGFDSARAAGVYSLHRTESGTIVPPVTAGEIRESWTLEYSP